nr:WD40 repeat domain-containing protein [Candidatus Laterigemmans baculatus]
MLEHRELASRESAVYDASFSPDGSRLALASDEEGIATLDASADFGAYGDFVPPRQAVTLAVEEVSSIAFSPDGQRLAASHFDGTIRVCDLATASTEWTRVAHTQGQASEVAFTRDGRGLISCGPEPVVRLWDASDGRPRGELKSDAPPIPNRRQAIHALAVSSDGQLMASAGGPDGNTLMIWNLPAQSDKHLLRGHQERLTSVAFSPDDRFVATGSIDKTVRVWDLSSKRTPRKGLRREVFVGEHLDSVRSVAFSPDGRWLATGDWNGAIRLWDLETLGIAALKEKSPIRSARPTRIWQAHAGRVYALEFAPQEPRLLSAGRDGKVHLWNLDSQPQRILPTPPGQQVSGGGAFTPDSRYFVRAQFGSLAFWNPHSENLETVVDVHDQSRESVAISPGNSCLYFGNGPGTVEVWDLRNRKFVTRWHVDGCETSIEPQAVSPDDSTLAATDWVSDVLWLFDTATGKATAIPAAQCHDAVFLRNGTEVAVDSLDDVLIWNVADQREVARLRGHHSTIEALAVSPDGQRLASCSQDRLVKIWDLQTNCELHLLSSHRDEVTAVTFSPDGRSVVSGDRSGTVLVWDVESGRLVCELENLAAEISQLEFSPDGTMLACHLLRSEQSVVMLDVSPPEEY